MLKTNLIWLIICIVAVLLQGFLSGISTFSEVEHWYAYIKKPFFNPPNYIFGPVWTLLYILMGITLYRLIKQNPSRDRSKALGAFFAQLALNFFWSYIFFNQHAIGLAFLEIVVMLISIVSMIVLVYRVNKFATAIQIPYFLWVTFASILNGAIFLLN